VSVGTQALLPTYLEGLDIVVEAEGGHGKQYVLPVDRLTLLSLTIEQLYSGFLTWIRIGSVFTEELDLDLDQNLE